MPFVSRLIAFIIAFTFITTLQAQQELKKMEPALLQQDFTVFRDSLQQLHPGLYRYRTKKAFDKLFDSCYATLNHPMTEPGYYSLFNFVVSAIEDGHTSANLPRESVNDLKANAKFFPVYARFIGKKAYVTCNSESFPAGTEITAIDQIPVNVIKERLFKYLPSDGSTETAKYGDINEGKAPFFFLYYLVYGRKDAFNVQYRLNAQQEKNILIQATTFNNIACAPAQPSQPEKYLQLEYKPGNIAVLTIKTFLADFLDRTKESFDGFLQTSFKEINDKKITTLIIDVRNNGGGNDDLGAHLYAYLTSKPFAYYASLQSTTRTFAENEHPNLSIQQPATHNFTGKVYFLINGNSFSATAEFCSIARSNNRGIFIGEETGGGYYGNTSGQRTTVTLPNTKIRINIPNTKYVMAVKKARYPDRGIIPDHIITPGINDYMQHKDVQLAYALKLAGKQ